MHCSAARYAAKVGGRPCRQLHALELSSLRCVDSTCFPSIAPCPRHFPVCSARTFIDASACSLHGRFAMLAAVRTTRSAPSGLLGNLQPSGISELQYTGNVSSFKRAQTVGWCWSLNEPSDGAMIIIGAHLPCGIGQDVQLN